jgi:hypothetical protein
LTDKFYYPGSVQECRLRFAEWATSAGVPLSLYHGALTWNLRGDFSPRVMEEAITETWRRHDAVAASYHFSVFGDSPALRLRTDVRPEIRLIDYRGQRNMGLDQKRGEARRLAQRLFDRRRPFDFAPQISALIAAISDDESLLSICYPSMMTDHWGHDVFVRDLAGAYGSLVLGGSVRGEAPWQYSQFAEYEFESLRDGTWAESVGYWADHYRGECPVPGLQITGWKGAADSKFLAGLHLSGEFPEATVTLLRSAWKDCARRGVTPYCFMLAVLLVLLYRLTGSEDLGVLIPAANRENWRYHDTVGLFATILAVRFRSLSAMTFSALCDLVRDELAGSMAHQRVSYHDMIRRLAPEIYGRPLRMVTCYFDYWIYNRNEASLSFGDAMAEPIDLDSPPHEQEGLGLNFYDDQLSSIRYSVSVPRRLFDSSAVAALMHDFEQLALCAAGNDEAVVSDLAAARHLIVPAAK